MPSISRLIYRTRVKSHFKPFFIYVSSSFLHIKFLWTYFLRRFYYFYHLVRINCSIPGNLKVSFHICSKDIRMNFNTHILSGKKIIESHFYTFWSWEFFLSKTRNLYFISIYSITTNGIVAFIFIFSSHFPSLTILKFIIIYSLKELSDWHTLSF